MADEGGGIEGLAALRSSQGFATVGSVVALVAAAFGVIFTTPSPTSALKLMDGSAFISDTENGAIVRANGATGAADMSIGLDPEAMGLEIVQRDGFAYAVVELEGGRKVLYRVGSVDGKRADVTKRPLASGERLVRGGDGAYLVNNAGGVVRAVDPESLEPLGKRPLRFDGRIVTVAGDDGTLLVGERRTGRLHVVDGVRAGSPVEVGEPGDDLAVGLVAGQPVLVNGTAGVAHVIEEGRVTTRVDLPTEGGRVVLPESTDRSELVLFQPAVPRIVLVDLDAASARSVTIEAETSDGVVAEAVPLATSWGVFLADAAAGSVDQVDLATGRLTPVDGTPLSKGEGNFQVFVKDGYLWLNSPGEAKATVIGPDGRARTIDKYEESIQQIDATNPTETPEPDPPPVPAPAPSPAPVAPAPASASSGSGPPAPIATAPSAPTGFAGQPGDRQVTLGWSIPPDGGSPLTRFLIGCSPDCGDGRTTVEVAPNAASTVISNLRNGRRHRYEFWIEAYNAVGKSPRATAGPYSPTPNVPGVPTAVVATANADGTVTVTWAEPEDSTIDPVTYTVTAASSSTTISGAATKQFVTPDNATTFTTPADALGYDDDADPDFLFTVAATSAGNVSGATSEPSAPVDPYNAPEPIDPTTATASGGARSLSAGWRQVNPRGRQVRYVVEQATSPPAGAVNLSAARVDQPADAAATVTYQRNSLQNGTRYHLRITPVNDAGQAPSLALEARPHDRPTITVGTVERGDRRFTLNYTVNWQGHAPGSCVATTNQGSAGTNGCTSVTVTSLPNEGCATVTITATNDAGDQRVVQAQGCALYVYPETTVRIEIGAFTDYDAPPICGQNDGVGVLRDLPYATDAPRIECGEQGEQFTALCWRDGNEIGDQNGVRSGRWFRVRTGNGDGYVNKLWLAGRPDNPGLDPCR